MKKLGWGSVYIEKILKNLFVEGVRKSIFRTLAQWSAEHQTALAEDLEQNAQSFIDFQRNKLRPDN